MSTPAPSWRGWSPTQCYSIQESLKRPASPEKSDPPSFAASPCSMLNLDLPPLEAEGPSAKRLCRFPSMSPKPAPSTRMEDLLPTITTAELFGTLDLREDDFPDTPMPLTRRSPSPPPLTRHSADQGPPLPMEIESFALPASTVQKIEHAGALRDFGGVQGWVLGQGA